MKSKTPFQQFEYRAYDSDLKIIEGREKARSFQHLALTLRQKGLQVIEAVALNVDDTVARQRLEKMKLRVVAPETDEEDVKPRRPIRSWLSALIHLFREG